MIEIKYGLFSAFVLFVWMIIEYTLLIPNFHEVGQYIGILSALIPVLGIFFGIKERRDKVNFGYISFKDAFKTGIVITFIIGVMIVVFTYVYYEYINPDFVNYLSAETEKKLIQQNVSREEINAALEIVRYQFSFSVQIIQQLLFVFVGGTIISIIIAMILKKHQRRTLPNS